MSVNIMSLVFKCNMPELKTDKGQTVPDSTSKFVLLALADHANDEGEGAYPSVKTICKKTNMSTATVVNALNALRTNGFTQLVGRSKRDTYNYTILVAKITAFQWVESSDSSGQNGNVSAAKIKPSPNHPLKPSVKEGATKPAAPRANDFPSNVLFREVTERYPSKANWHDVLKFVDGVSRRLGREPVKEDLLPFYSAWCAMGWNANSINWLEYAVKGTFPGKQQPTPTVSVAQSWLARKEQEAQNVRA
jgi:hypothetical protein